MFSEVLDMSCVSRDDMKQKFKFFLFLILLQQMDFPELAFNWVLLAGSYWEHVSNKLTATHQNFKTFCNFIVFYVRSTSLE